MKISLEYNLFLQLDNTVQDSTNASFIYQAHNSKKKLNKILFWNKYFDFKPNIKFDIL